MLNIRLWNFVSNRCAKLIQKFFKYVLSLKKEVLALPVSETIILQQCAKKLARMILELYLDRTRRKDLIITMHQSAPEIQKLVRMFLAKKGKQKMSFLRNAFRSWIKPQFAIEFMNNYLNTKIFFLKNKKNNQIIIKSSEAIIKKSYVRDYLPDNKKNAFEIDYRLFDTVIDLWYKGIGIPLSEGEKKSIKNTFKNPMVVVVVVVVIVIVVIVVVVVI